MEDSGVCGGIKTLMAIPHHYQVRDGMDFCFLKEKGEEEDKAVLEKQAGSSAATLTSSLPPGCDLVHSASWWSWWLLFQGETLCVQDRLRAGGGSS